MRRGVQARVGAALACLLLSIFALVQAAPAAPSTVLSPRSALHVQRRGSLLRIRGGSPSKTENAKGGGLSEDKLAKILGRAYTMDMTNEENAKIVARYIRQYQKGTGVFNEVRLDGDQYTLWGVQEEKGGEEELDEDGEPKKDAFYGMRGKTAATYHDKNNARVDLQNDMMKKAKNAMGKLGEQKIYTEADMAGKTASERQYLMDMNQHNAEEVAVEIPLVTLFTTAYSWYQKMWPKKKITMDDIGDMDEVKAITEIMKRMPKKGVLYFRFKEKKLQTMNTPPVNAQKASWAGARAQAVKRNGGAVSKEAVSDKEETPLDTLKALFKPTYYLRLGFDFVWGTTCFFAQLVFSILKLVTFQSGRDTAKIKAALAQGKGAA